MHKAVAFGSIEYKSGAVRGHTQGGRGVPWVHILGNECLGDRDKRGS